MSRELYEELKKFTLRAGASAAQIIDTKDIVIDEKLADMCREPECENYGISPHCPPHTSGPVGFRQLLGSYQKALVFKIEIPTDVLVYAPDEDRRELFRMLQQISAQVEGEAIQKGFFDSKGFAGGSCKKLFCLNDAECRVLSRGEACPFPDQARPSMSGFGINVSKLMESAGWTLNKVLGDEEKTEMTQIVGLILVGEFKPSVLQRTAHP